MLLFYCLVWQTLIARKLVFLRQVSAHKGVPGLAKGCEATVIAWEWKGSFRNSDCQHGPPIYRVMQAAAELALRPLLPIFCPAPLPPVAGRPWFHMSQLPAAVPAWAVCREICMLQCPVELLSATGPD